jgi:biotin-dependent carboxylase-like uncharacterized protein
MSVDTLRVESAGFGGSLQDRGRFGWRRFGVPCSGCMDDHAADWANRLLDNPPTAVLLEIQFQGLRFTILEDAWVAITGADLGCNVDTWRAVRLAQGDVVHFPQSKDGLWAYVAVEGGFAAEIVLGSRSAYPRGNLGRSLNSGDVLARFTQHSFALPKGVASRVAPWTEQRKYTHQPILRVWPGPQWHAFTAEDQETFFNASWSITSQSDRVGYRLTGPRLEATPSEIISEPVRVGSIQMPENGQPIVTMRDGPTVGGYPKIGLLDRRDVSWLAQCRRGQNVRFQLVK